MLHAKYIFEALEACLEACLKACFEACFEACFILKSTSSRLGGLPRSLPRGLLHAFLKTYSRGSGSLPRGLPRSLSGGLHHAITNPRRLGGLPRGLPRSLPGSLLDADKHVYFRCFEASMRPSLCATCGLKFYKAPQFPTATPSPFPWDSNNSII